MADEIQSSFSHPLHILSGNEEAALIAEGLLQDPQLSGCDSFQAFDLGGGSPELIQIEDRCPTLNNSLPLGVLSVSNQLTSGNQFPLSAKDIKSLRDVVCNEVRNCDFILDPGIPLIGLGGAIFLSVKSYQDAALLIFTSVKSFNLGRFATCGAFVSFKHEGKII